MGNCTLRSSTNPDYFVGFVPLPKETRGSVPRCSGNCWTIECLTWKWFDRNGNDSIIHERNKRARPGSIAFDRLQRSKPFSNSVVGSIRSVDSNGHSRRVHSHTLTRRAPCSRWCFSGWSVFGSRVHDAAAALAINTSWGNIWPLSASDGFFGSNFIVAQWANFSCWWSVWIGGRGGKTLTDCFRWYWLCLSWSK